MVLLLGWPSPPLLLYWPVSCSILHALDATPPHPQPYGCAVLSYLSHFFGLRIDLHMSSFLSRSFLSPVSAWYSSALSGSEWQPACNRLAQSFSINQSARADWSHRCPIGPRHTSATAGDLSLDTFPNAHLLRILVI